MSIYQWIVIASITSSLILSTSLAGELPDGRTFFETSPRLINLTTTLSGVRQWGAKYYLTIYLPEDAVEPLGKLTLIQTSGAENIKFNLSETFAFLGTKDERGEEINVTAELINTDRENQTIALIFPNYIPLGTTFTIGLKPIRNPEYGGNYSFRVKAFPQGEKPSPLDLGVRALYFREPDGDSSSSS
jgi:hypothetical protein